MQPTVLHQVVPTRLSRHGDTEFMLMDMDMICTNEIDDRVMYYSDAWCRGR